MKTTRIILVLIFGGLLTYLTYKSKYQTFFFQDGIWGSLILIGIVLLLWTIVKDIKSYKLGSRLTDFLSSFIAVLFIAIILILEYNINNDFNKDSLIKVFYDGDYNGTGIDFKKDGTYIFDNSAIGVSDYQYGTYRIQKDTITLDKKQLDNVITTERLVIRDKEIEYSDGTRREKYLYQVANDGQIIKRATEFRVVVDNREN